MKSSQQRYVHVQKKKFVRGEDITLYFGENTLKTNVKGGRTGGGWLRNSTKLETQKQCQFIWIVLKGTLLRLTFLLQAQNVFLYHNLP